MIIVEKLSKIFTFMKPSKKVKHRTLMLVGSHGEAIAVRRFFGLAMLATCIAFMASVAIVYLVFTSQGLRNENKELRATVTTMQKKIQHLKNENNIFMARLVAQSNEVSGEPDAQVPAAEAPPDHRSSQEPLSQLNIDKGMGFYQQPGGDQISGKIIEVENLLVTHEATSKTLQVKFDLRNADPDLKPISGRTVVILKTDDPNQNNWLTLPFVPLVSGKPASTTTGRTFLISRFKTVKFSIAGQLHPNRYKTATVFIFSKAGEILLEKDFKVDVKTIVASVTRENSI